MPRKSRFMRTSQADRPPQATLRNSGRRLAQILGTLRRNKVNEGLTPTKLRVVFEELGPTFVKLGQIMSLRSDMLPKEYCDELAKLRVKVDPLPWDQIRPHLERELGYPVSEVFSDFDAEPLGSASIAQVYRARLASGEDVAVKVQRPGITESMTQDIALMQRAVDTIEVVGPRAATQLIDLPMLVNELWTSFKHEVDFLHEAYNIQEFASDNRDIAYTGAPEVYENYCTAQVLVMEYIDGIPIDDADGLRAAGYDLSEIGTKLAESFTKQVLDDGFFHADPHPGNLIVRDGQIVWIDFGMMGRFSNHDRLLLRSIIEAMVAGDAAKVKEGLLTAGQATGKVDHAGLLTDIEAMLDRYGFTDIEDLDMGSALADLFELVRRNNIKLPTSYLMLGRGYVTLEATVADCKPSRSTLQVMSAHLQPSLLDAGDPKEDLARLALSLRTSAEKCADLPARVSDLVDMASRGQVKTNFDLTGSEAPINRMGQILDRIGIALVASALFIGSSILCLTDMQPQVLGIPILGFAGYVGALVLSLWFIITVWKRRGRDR